MPKSSTPGPGHASKQANNGDIKYSRFAPGKQSEKVNIGLGDSGRNMFEPTIGGEERRSGVKSWSLNRRIADESMLAYSNRARNLADKYQQDLVDHRDRLAIQALIQRARGHKKWAPLPKVGLHERDKNDRLDLRGVGGKREDVRASSDLGVQILYHSDWGESRGSPHPIRPASDSFRGVMPSLGEHRPYLQPLEGYSEESLAALNIHSVRTVKSDQPFEENWRDSPYFSSPETGMADKEGSPKGGCSVEIVAFPEIPLQIGLPTTHGVLHSKPVALQSRQRATKQGKKLTKTKDSREKTPPQFNVRGKLPPVSKLDPGGVRAKRAPFVRKGASEPSRISSADKTALKLAGESTGKHRKSSADSEKDDDAHASSKNKGAISATLKKRGKKILQDSSVEDVSPPPNTPVVPIQDADLESVDALPATPNKENSDAGTIKSVLSKGKKRKSKSVQFGAELEFVKMVTKIEYPWYNEDTDTEDDDAEEATEEEDTAEESASDSSSDDDSDAHTDKGDSKS